MRVAIVNAQPAAVDLLRRIVAAEQQHTVAWTAGDGDEAVRRCQKEPPDVVLMDLVLPILNGVEATRLIMQRCPVAIVIVTGNVTASFDMVCKALTHGAYDAICTPTAATSEAGKELIYKLGVVARMKGHLSSVSGIVPRPTTPPTPPPGPPKATIPVVAIGASTGGPSALDSVLGRWPADFPAAVVIAQHIAPDFAPSLVEWLGEHCPLKVRIASAGDRPEPGVVLIANGVGHLVMTAKRTWSYVSDPRECPFQPSVDALFRSLTAHWPWPSVAVLLTGIGRDGRRACSN